MMRLLIAMSAALVATAEGAAAHGGSHADPWAWTLDPWALVPLGLSAALYAAGLARLWRRAGVGRGARPVHVILVATGYAAAVLALGSPVDGLADALLSVHMVQHLGLMLVAAPLLVLGRPASVFLHGLPRRLRRPVARIGTGGPVAAVLRIATHPFGAWGLYLSVLWVWHIPALYQRAILDDALHALQHASFLAVGILLWTAVIERARRGLDHGASFLAIFATAVHSCALGAILTVSATVWYPVYAERTAAFGLTPLQDQQVGGLIMWVPSGLLFAAAGLLTIAAWLRVAERRAARLSALRAGPVAGLALVAILAGCVPERVAPPEVADVVRRHGCGTCHFIPGIPGANGRTGPPLDEMDRQAYVAGVLPKERETLVRFILAPQAVDPRSAMPDLGVAPDEARLLADYLLAGGVGT